MSEERRADRHLNRLPRQRLVALLAAGVLVGVLGGYLAGARGRSAAPAEASTRVHATAECTSAVARANTSLAYAVKMGRAFGAQSRVIDALARGELSTAQALEASSEPRAEGTAAGSKFEGALADYLRVVDSCQLESR